MSGVMNCVDIKHHAIDNQLCWYQTQCYR